MKIFVSTFPYSRSSSEPLALLKNSKYDFKINTSGRKLTGQELYENAKDATAIIVGTEDLSILVDRSEKLKLIARIGIGLDSVPLIKCLEKGIQVCYTPDAVTDAVAELTLGLMIALTRNVHLADREIRRNGWQRFEGKSLKEQTIGLVGFGRIGKKVAEYISVFNPSQILIHDVLDKNNEIIKIRKDKINIAQVNFEELISRSDTISLHIPKTPKTQNLINEETILQMKKSALLINTARGGIINEADLLKYLLSGHLAGAALDVFEKEPYMGELCQLPNVILTQHMGSCSIEARNRMEKEATEDVLRFVKNEPLLCPVDLEKEISFLMD